jgi:hypothetical protein
MARRKPAKKATKKSAAKASARKSAKKTTKKAAKKAGSKPAKKAAKPVKRAAAKKVVKKAAPTKKAVARKASPPKKAAAAKKAAPKKAVAKPAPAPVAKAASAPKKTPNLDRPRKTVAEVHGIPSSLDLNRTASAAKSGRAEMRNTLSKNTGGGPALTGGDVDADWQSAESIGDEAPGGDNPTPDQDVVDDIGRSLGVEYADDEELQGGAEISERDTHRWELDPSSKDDFEDEE